MSSWADTGRFLREFARDPLLGETLKRIRGLRPMRTQTVAQSLLRAVAGQLIQAKRAREIERAVVRAAAPSLDGLHAAPTCAELGRFSPAELARFGLSARRAGALVRLCRSIELERLKGLPTRDAAARLERERGRARRGGEPPLEPCVLGLEAPHLGPTLRERAPRLEVGLERPVVEEGEEGDAADRQPAQEPPRARLATLAPGRGGHGAPFARRGHVPLKAPLAVPPPGRAGSARASI
jgi:hypothetical protein